MYCYGVTENRSVKWFGSPGLLPLAVAFRFAKARLSKNIRGHNRNVKSDKGTMVDRGSNALSQLRHNGVLNVQRLNGVDAKRAKFLAK